MKNYLSIKFFTNPVFDKNLTNFDFFKNQKCLTTHNLKLRLYIAGSME
jgi:hypothetical protein